MGSIAAALTSLLGADQVTSWETVTEPLRGAIRGAIAADSWPAVIVYPTTAEELAAVMTLAWQNQWRVLPCGHGSKLRWGSLIQGAELVISTARLNRVVEHAIGDLTVTVEAGVAVADLQAQLLETRQFLAIDPAYPQQATVGGIVATRDTGAWRQRYGGIRDMLIGVSFVRHDGQIAKAGGRVVKNVAGYDLMKLMTGSFGTLGMLTQLTWRTYPLPEASRTALITGSADAIRAVTAAVLQSSLTPVAMDLLSSNLLSTGDRHTVGLALQFQSIEAGVTEQVERLQAIAQSHALSVQVFTDTADTEFWHTLTTHLYAPNPDLTTLLAKVGTLPEQALPLLSWLASTLPPGTWQARIHASSGIGTWRLSCEGNTPEGVAKVRSHLQSHGGYLTLLEAPADWKRQLDPWALPPDTQLLMTRLQDQFDPQRRLSPGRWG